MYSDEAGNRGAGPPVALHGTCWPSIGECDARSSIAQLEKLTTSCKENLQNRRLMTVTEKDRLCSTNGGTRAQPASVL